MGFEHTIDREKKFATIVGHGALDFEISIGALRALAADLQGETGYGILIDVRDTEYLASTPEIRRYAELVGAPGFLRGHRLAIVTTSGVRYGNARMFSTYLEMQGGESDVFKDVESAMDWLSGSGKPPLSGRGSHGA